MNMATPTKKRKLQETVELPHEASYWPQVRKILEKLADRNNKIDSIRTHLVDLQNIIPFKPYKMAMKTYTFNSIKNTIFDGLDVYYETYLSVEEKETFTSTTVPFIASLALEIEELCPPSGIPISRQNVQFDIVLNRRFVACLIAHAFLCLTRDHGDVTDTFPYFTFKPLYNWLNRKDVAYIVAKMKMFMNYFNR